MSNITSVNANGLSTAQLIANARKQTEKPQGDSPAFALATPAAQNAAEQSAIHRKTGSESVEAAGAAAQTQASAASAEAQQAQATQTVDKTKEVQKADLPTAADLKAEQNRAILEANMQVSLSSGNDSLSLMLKAAIEGINKELEPTLGKDAIQNAMNQDNTPEGTAGRIVQLSTAFFDAYARQNPGKDPETLVNDFMATIQRGFERGYGDATDVLKGLQVFDGDLKAGIEKTYELVQKGYAEFAQNKLEGLSKAQNDEAGDQTTAVQAENVAPAPGVGETKDTGTEATRA